MQIVEIQCIILCHKAEQAAGLKFFEPPIKVENWQLEIESFHNHITACKELVAFRPALRRPKMIHTTAIPTVVELKPVGISMGITHSKRNLHTASNMQEKYKIKKVIHNTLCSGFCLLPSTPFLHVLSAPNHKNAKEKPSIIYRIDSTGLGLLKSNQKIFLLHLL